AVGLARQRRIPGGFVVLSYAASYEGSRCGWGSCVVAGSPPVLAARSAIAPAATRQRALTSRPRWNPAVSASGRGVWAASRWLVRLVAIPLNTARPSADPSWKEAVIRAAANP